VGFSEPIGARRVGSRVDDPRIKRGYVAGYFVPPMVDLIAKAQIDGQIRAEFDIVLNNI